MNKKIEEMMREIERRGGVVGVNASLPDEVAEMFLKEILECPECCATQGSSADSIGRRDVPMMLAASARRMRRTKTRQH